jgi:hypothetical protein
MGEAWTNKADMITARYGLGTSAGGSKIYAIGGIDAGGIPLSKVEEYDTVLDIWTPKKSMPTERGNLSTCVLNGRIYAIDGAGADGLGLSIVEEYTRRRVVLYFSTG